MWRGSLWRATKHPLIMTIRTCNANFSNAGLVIKLYMEVTFKFWPIAIITHCSASCFIRLQTSNVGFGTMKHRAFLCFSGSPCPHSRELAPSSITDRLIVYYGVLVAYSMSGMHGSLEVRARPGRVTSWPAGGGRTCSCNGAAVPQPEFQGLLPRASPSSVSPISHLWSIDSDKSNKDYIYTPI